MLDAYTDTCACIHQNSDDTEKDSADFLDSMYASFLLPYITIPSRVTPCSKTLTNNNFSNNIEDGSISVNIVTISDHYVQFLLLLQHLNNKSPTNSKIYHLRLQNTQ